MVTMNDLYIYFKKNKQVLLSLALFALAISFLVISLPKDRKFQYEYQQNKVWQHEDLVAPFSFSIHKSESAIKHEQDSILQDFSPVFAVDTSVLAAVSDSLKYQLNAHLRAVYQGEDLEILMQNSDLSNFYSRVKAVYKAGVYNVAKPEKTLILENGSRRSRIAFSRLYSMREAAEKLSLAIPERLRTSEVKEIIYHILKPSVIYNEARSVALKEQLLSQISEKYDFINEGSLIIKKGDVVTEHTTNVLNSLKREYSAQLLTKGNSFIIFLGQLILIIIALIVLFLLLSFTHIRKIVRNFKQSLFILTIVMLFMIMAAISNKFDAISINLIPYVALPIIIKLFINRRIAVFTHIITMLIIGFLAPNSYYFVFTQTCVGMIALFAIGDHYERRSLFLTAAVSFVSYVVIYIGFSLMSNGSLSNFNIEDILWFAASCILLLTTYLFVWVFEKTFGLTSDLTYFELTDTNHGILRELSQKAPGTFQHSLQVENLVEAALQEINGNVSLGRAAALYHDIGKLKNSQYFVENQLTNENLHDHLEPEESARILIEHVTYGRELAEKHNLPQQLCNMIYSHHGTSQPLFFVRKQKDLYPNKPIDAKKFTYPRVVMKDKELAVLMIADVVEAAVRSLKVFTKEKIDDVVAHIIDDMMETKRLRNFDITLREIEKVREVLVEKLVNVYHSRIEYPKPENEQAEG